MEDYRKHIATKRHQTNLSFLRGDIDNRSEGDKRDKSLKSHQNSTNYSTTVNRHQFQRNDCFKGNKTSQFGKNKQNQASHFRFGGVGNGYKRNLWNDRYQYNDNGDQWSRNYMHNTYITDKYLSGERGYHVNPQVNQFYEPWGSRAYGDYPEYHSNEEFAISHKGVNMQQNSRINSFYQDEFFENLKDASLMNAVPGAWNEQLLLQQEQFLADMDDEDISIKHSSHFRQCSANGEKHNSSTQDRKRTRDESDGLESRAKFSRSMEVSSDPSTSVQKSLSRLSRYTERPLDIDTRVQVPHRNHETVHRDAVKKKKSVKLSRSNISSDPSTPVKVVSKKRKTAPDIQNRKSMPILTPDLDVHTQNSFTGEGIFKQLHTNLVENVELEKYRLKSKDCDVYENKRHLLQQKKSCNKSKTEDSERPLSIEKCRSNLTQNIQNDDLLAYSAVTNKSTDTFTSASQPKYSIKSLDDIKSSIEKSVLENQEQSQRKLKSSPPPKKKHKRCLSSDAVPGICSENPTNTTFEKPLPKLVHKSQLSKDSIKKIVNDPHSRDERLQLAKMLQSREEHRTTTSSAPRTRLQLEGLHDCFIVSQEKNSDGSQNSEIQTIKIEDLSESVRNQILDLIGVNDVSSRIGDPETTMSSLDQLTKESSLSKVDVIVLSDDENSGKIKSKLKKSKKNSSNIALGVSSDDKVTKIRKKLAVPASKTDLICSVASSLHQPVVSKMSDKSSKATKNNKLLSKKQKKVFLCPENDIEIVSHSSDGELDTDKPALSRKEDSYELISTKAVTSHTSRASAGGTKQNIAMEEVHPYGHQNKNLLNSSVLGEEFPVLQKRFEITSSATSRTDVSSQISSCSQSYKQLIDDVASSNVQNNPQPDREAILSVPYTEKLSSSMQSRIVSSSLPTGERSPSSDTGVRLHSTDAEVIPHSPETVMRLPSQTTMERLPSSDTLAIPSSLDEEERTSLPLTEQQRTSIKSTETCSTLQGTSSNTQTLKRLTLPPSMWLSDRSPSSHSCKDNNMTAVESSMLSDLVKDPKIEDTPGTDTVTIDDADSEQISSTSMSNSSAVVDKFSNSIMSELLVLSEREENVKHEKISMDLRLSRLHKLLEQAVVQINKCTERREQLHEEEQELSKQRLSLLRAILSTTEKASLSPNRKSNVTVTSNETFSSIVTSDDHPQTSTLGQSLMQENLLPVCSTQSVLSIEHEPAKSMIPTSTSVSFDETSMFSGNMQGTSLSRADWLAKFSSYLPSVPIREGNKKSAAKTVYIATNSQLKELVHHSSVPVSSLNLLLSSDDLDKRKITAQCQMAENVEIRNQESCEKTP